MIRERELRTMAGLPMLLVLILVEVALLWSFVGAVRDNDEVALIVWLLASCVVAVLFFGVFTVNPNEGRVLELFGRYVGTARTEGMRWANPFYSKRRVSLRVRNFESAKLKGERSGRQSDRDRRCRRLAGRGHGRGGILSRRLLQLRPRAERGGAAQPGDELHVRFPRRGPAFASRQHRRHRRAPEA